MNGESLLTAGILSLSLCGQPYCLYAFKRATIKGVSQPLHTGPLGHFAGARGLGFSCSPTHRYRSRCSVCVLRVSAMAAAVHGREAQRGRDRGHRHQGEQPGADPPVVV